LIHQPDGRTERRIIASVEDYLATLAGPLRIRLPESPQLREKLRRLLEADPG
jgi:hypothetical protein